LKIRGKQWKRQRNIQEYIEEWYVLAFLLTGDKVVTERLLERTMVQVKDKLFFVSFDRHFLKQLIKEYTKYYRNNDIIYTSIDTSILLSRLGLLDEPARIAFLLKYVYGFSYKKIAQVLLTSERKVK